MNTNNNSVDRPDVVVVGGGIGGLAAALALTRTGLRVRVLEQASEFGEVGAGIQLAPNCTRILDKYGLLDEARSLGVVPERLVMRDAVDGRDLTSVDLRDLEKRYGSPYLVIHRTDLHGLLLRACRSAGVDLLTNHLVVGYDQTDDGAGVRLADGTVHEAPLVIAADGIHSVARRDLVGDDVVSSRYVAYRGALPVEQVRDHGIDFAEDQVVVHVGPQCHFVQYPLRGGTAVNQVAVFESPKARAGEEEWGTPDELDGAFAATCDHVLKSIGLMWRDKWWQMSDRDPISTWVYGRIVLLGDAAHPPLQYLAQGAVMAIEDGYVLAHHLAETGVDHPAEALAAYEAVRTEHCRRVQTTARVWGDLWHLDGDRRLRRNEILRERSTDDYSFIDWIYGPTALTPEQEPEMFVPIPLEGATTVR
ncbi:FAD-dependent monooxygenase [Streptomyces sp. NPDC050625]|uniref:FAD-dependent monooxygenase n=1 Tax=Streptomyces sp. NPDC050625 TaxID=3154629 RepID=UPI00341E2286